MAKVKNQSTFIYTLSNPITKEVRYIGKTVNIKDRYRQHIGKRLLDNSHKNNWISSLINAGLQPIIEVLDIVEHSEWEFWEKYWISQFKTCGFDLTNATEGGECGSCGNRESINKMVKTRKLNNSYKRSEESKNSLSDKYKLDGNPFYNKTHTEEAKNKIGKKSKENNSKWIALITEDTLLIFNSYGDLAKHEKCHIGTITKRLKRDYNKYYKINKEMSWIKCPVCNGTGVITKDYSENNCKTCNGRGIISELTGFPPKYINENISSMQEGCSHKRIEEIQGGQIEMCKDCGKTCGR